MNPTLELIHNRRSTRVYDPTPLTRAEKDAILNAAMRAPTAGAMMLYTIIEVNDQALKDRLAATCDNQPFIARAPMVWLFLADYQRWQDYFIHSNVEKLEKPMRAPEEGDLFLACCDALIAAQNAVIAAESLGVGSCYIGDIMENYEFHQELFNLPQYTFPITLLCLGYPKSSTAKLTPRFPQENIHFKNSYQRIDQPTLKKMLDGREPQKYIANATNIGQHFYARKFSADFSVEMTRSVKKAIQSWAAQNP